MKSKIIFLSVLLASMSIVLIFLTSPTFAQDYQYTESKSITCGNGVCEEVRFQLKKGEEKAVEIAGETYNFKLLDIIREGYSDKYLIAVNGEEMTSEEILEQYGFQPRIPSRPGAATVLIQVYETSVNGCAVPDCAFRVELDLNKKWNLVPLYLLGEVLSETVPELRKGTCELQDVLVIYVYHPIEKNYVKLHTYGKSLSDEGQSSFSDLDEKLLAISPYNSVWVYSLSECRLAAELPKEHENFLLVMEPWKEQGGHFASGWNFWVGSKDMQGKSFDEMKGSCTIERAYTFDASSQSWKALETPPGPETNFIFKVKDACMFGEKVTIPEAPALPE